MAQDYYEFMNQSPEEMLEDWLDFIRARDPLLQDVSDYTFNRVLGEAIAAQFWIAVQLVKQIMIDTNAMTASGDKLSTLVLDRLPEGRYPGTRACGAIKFMRNFAGTIDHVIPAGTIVAAVGEDGSFTKFQTTEEVTLAAGTTSITAAARAIDAGVGGNVAANTVTSIVTPVNGIQSATNELAFSGGTDQESDNDLRFRYIYAIWETGKATCPMMVEHIKAVQPVREVSVTTVGQGDVFIVVDSEGGVAADAEEIAAIEDEIADNLAAGCTSPGLLAATIRSGGNTFEIGDSSGGRVWVRTRQYISAPTTVPFEYVNTNGETKNGTITLPAGTPEGGTLPATMQEVGELATLVTGSVYPGGLELDIYIAMGTYPNCWVCPELQAVGVTGTVILEDTAEAGLLDSIKASVQARLNAYKVGETIHHSHVLRCFFVDYATGRAFQGVHDVPILTLTCKEMTISFGESLAIDNDERAEPGTLDITETVH